MLDRCLILNVCDLYVLLFFKDKKIEEGVGITDLINRIV